ncbi:hypothetical protein ACCO45_003585 [Purpureocillium lilacinum]|uniref:Uncharacterized protein n=1 Tax=Purpureocillium lilacinum TaxID=33203 RepID=A0ACC4E0B1_PURLI
MRVMLECTQSEANAAEICPGMAAAGGGLGCQDAERRPTKGHWRGSTALGGMAPDDSPNRKIPSPSTSLARLSLAAQFTLRDPLDQGLLVDSGLSSTRLRRRLGPSHNATPVNKAAVYAWI